VNLDLYKQRAEALPITRTTPKSVWTEQWSGKVIHPDRVENIGKCTRLALDRQELETNGSVVRRRIAYYMENPDADDGPDAPQVDPR